MDSNIVFEKKFLSKIRKTNKCWIWQGCTVNSGYGISYKENYKTKLAHRISFQFYNRMIPTNMQVLHKCDNKLCVNPRHLFLGTQKDNIQDCIKKGRLNNGEKAYNHKLTSKDVLSIRAYAKINRIHKPFLSKKYKVCKQTIFDVVSRRSWKHV